MRTLLARKLDFTDLEQRVEWFNHPKIYCNMPLDIPVGLSGTQQWFNKTVLSSSRRDFCFDVEDSTASLFVAAMGGLVEIEHQHQRAALYVLVNPGHISKGIGQAATGWLCNYGFWVLGLQKIYLFTFSDNVAANKLYERLGFVKEGVLRNHHYHLGKFVDRYVFGLLRNDWQDASWNCGNDFSFQIAF